MILQLLKKCKGKLFGFIIIIVTLFSSFTPAQWKFTLSTDHEFNSNPFRSPFSEQQFYYSFNIGIEKEFKDISILYYGSYSRFYETNERNSYWHQLGFYNNDESTKFGIYANQRFNTTEYDFFNYSDVTGYLKQKIDWTFMNVLLQTSTTYKMYNNLKSYNNALFTFGLQLNKSFETKTTFILQSLLSYKNYVNTGTESITQGRSGKGMMWGSGYNSTYADTVSYPKVTSTQVFSSVRIAQSIFEGTGIAVYYQKRSLIEGSGTWYGSVNYNYGDESDLYDDPISRRENTFGFELTQVLPELIILKLGYMYSDRIYPSQGIYTDAETLVQELNRNDKQNYYYVNISKSFLLSEESEQSLNLNIAYSYISNESNSFWYNYNFNQVSLNLGFVF
jgi:hypothetical protein